MKKTANGTCTFCSDLDHPIFRIREPFEKARDELAEAAQKVAEPATPFVNAVLVGGVAAGVLFGCALLWKKIRK